MAQSNFRPRLQNEGLAGIQTNTCMPWTAMTVGDATVLAQQNQYFGLLQNLIGSIRVPPGQLTVAQAQQQLLAISVPMTIAAATSYASPNAITPGQWANVTPSPIVDYYATYQQVLSTARANGWV
jgi:hypothetical protein